MAAARPEVLCLEQGVEQALLDRVVMLVDPQGLQQVMLVVRVRRDRGLGIHFFSAGNTVSVGRAQSEAGLVADAILVRLQQLELASIGSPSIRGRSFSGRPFAVIRQMRPWVVSRRGSRSEYCMWPISGLNQSAI